MNNIKDTARDVLFSTLEKCGYIKYASSRKPSFKNTGSRLDRFNSMLSEYKTKKAEQEKQNKLDVQKAAEAAQPLVPESKPSPLEQWKQNTSNFADMSRTALGQAAQAPMPQGSPNPQQAGLPQPPSTQVPPQQPPKTASMKFDRDTIDWLYKYAKMEEAIENLRRNK